MADRQARSYKLIQRIGSGFFGDVWRAEAPGGVAVAIKIISRQLDDEQTQREVALLEFIKGMRNPHLLPTTAFWSESDKLYLVMLLADGNVRDRDQQCRAAGVDGIPVEELIGYFQDAALGLEYLHSQDMLHGDIHPGNLLLIRPQQPQREGNESCLPGMRAQLKLGDFGLMRQLASQRMHATGAGKPAYMPPEVWSGQPSKHSDQYSLALTYAELRRGRPVIPAVDLIQMMRAHLQGQPDLAGLKPGEQAVLGKALDKDPTKRFESCLAFIDALAEAMLRPRR
jgi:serine/threonine protein kinase